ncbi:hypothetical protein BDN70DRAFT_924711 [Pholiota conissans]|uniref:Uncharacterized protein n=1 Tax=Pholiota conissans TaxID=109636 RepID=A0A9P5YT70_9AGAR|nr:hypothetical protein BDN70DRAFT_924711 [Pholiota conissans]
MNQDGRASQSESSSDSLLQVVLLAFDRDGIRDPIRDHYAAILFPRSYEDAITSIREAFKEYLRSKPGQDECIDIYMPMLNLQGKSVFARADKKHWNLIVPKLRKSALGLREVNVPCSGVATFFDGLLWLAHGKRENGCTSWAKFNSRIDRPHSYQEAIEIIMQCKNNYQIQSTVSLRIGDKRKFKFFHFKDQLQLQQWKEFPEAAHSSEVIWQSVVPEGGETLGFMLV